MPASISPVLIVVADRDLAEALTIGLQACGVACDICEDAGGVSPEALRDRQALLIDVVLLSIKPQRSVAALRDGGWTGLTVLLAEDSELKQSRFEPFENVTVLTKPFGSAQLLDIAERLGAHRAGLAAQGTP